MRNAGFDRRLKLFRITIMFLWEMVYIVTE